MIPPAGRVFKDAPCTPKCFFDGVNICPNWEHHRSLSHSRRQIETHPSRTLTDDARGGAEKTRTKKAQRSPPNFAEYASPLLLYTPSPSMIRTNAGYADPQRLRRLQNLSQGQQQHHSLQHNHQHQRSEPNWEEFFPPPPPPPQQLQLQEQQQEASVACYASTEICKVQSELRENVALISRKSCPNSASSNLSSLGVCNKGNF